MASKKNQKKSFTQMSIKDMKAARKRKEMEKVLDHPEFVPTLPSVDLFPEDVRDVFRVKQARKFMIAVGVAAVLGVGGMWYSQGQGISDAETALATASEENSKLQMEIRALTPVKSLYDEITAQEAVVNAALAADVNSTGVLDEINKVGDEAGVTFDNISVAYIGSPTAQTADTRGKGFCPNVDPFGTLVTVGCVTFSAKTADRTNIANFINVADGNPFFASPYVSSTTQGEDGAIFNGTVALTADALRVPLSPEQLQTLLTPPKPKPTQPAEGDAAATGDEAPAE